MNREESVLQHILTKYNPAAVYISGSRARNKERVNSDWDLHIVVADYINPVSERFDNELIDIKSISESKVELSLIDTPYSPAVPFRILYKDEKRKNTLDDLERRTIKAYESGPVVWSEEALNENRARMERFLEAIEGTVDEPMISFRHLAKFFDLSLLYWFGVRGRWSVPIYEALEVFKREDQEFFEAIYGLVSSKDPIARAQYARCMHNNLFE